MGREKTGSSKHAAGHGHSLVSKPAKAEEAALDPQKSVRLWRKGKRKQAHDELDKIIQTNPSPLAFTGRTWVRYMEWDELRQRSTSENLQKLEESCEPVKAAAVDGVNFKPASITCAEILLTMEIQLIEAYSREDMEPNKVDILRSQVVDNCRQYLNKDTAEWCDPSDETYPGMQGAEQRMKETPKQRLLIKLEKFREYKQRFSPSIARGYHGLTGLETSAGPTVTASIQQIQHFRDAAIEKKLEKLRAEVHSEQTAAQRREDGAREMRANNPRLVQHYLHHNGGSNDQQAEVSQQERQMRRGRGGRGRSGTVEESRLEQSRNKKEIKDKAAREEKLRKGEETKQFLKQILPEDKEERMAAFLDMLTVDLSDLKAKASKLRDKELQDRIKIHLAHLEQHGVWHFYSSLTSSKLDRDECFHSTEDLHDHIKRKDMQPNDLQVYIGGQLTCELGDQEPAAHPDPVPAFISLEHSLNTEDNRNRCLSPMEDLEHGMGIVPCPEHLDDGILLACGVASEEEDAAPEEAGAPLPPPPPLPSPLDSNEAQPPLLTSHAVEEDADRAAEGPNEEAAEAVPEEQGKGDEEDKDGDCSMEVVDYVSDTVPDYQKQLRDALTSKMKQSLRDPLHWYNHHLVEHLNMQEVSEEIHEPPTDEMIPFVRHWNCMENNSSGFWSPRKISQEYLENMANIGEQLLTISRLIDTRQRLQNEQETSDLCPDKAVELQGKLQETEQEIQILIFRLKGVGPAVEEANQINESPDEIITISEQHALLGWQELPEEPNLRPEYMRGGVKGGEHQAPNEGAEGGGLPNGGSPPAREQEQRQQAHLERKQALLSDVWLALKVLQHNRLLTKQLLQVVGTFIAWKCPELELPLELTGGPEPFRMLEDAPSEDGAALVHMGRLPLQELEYLRVFALQQLGFRGRVLSSFYITSQAEEERELCHQVGFEKEDSKDSCMLRFMPVRYDFMRQQAAEQRAAEEGQRQPPAGSADDPRPAASSSWQEVQHGAASEGQQLAAATPSSSGAAADLDLEPDVQAAILDELYNILNPEDPMYGDDCRTQQAVAQYMEDFQKVSQSLGFIQADLETAMMWEQIIGYVESQLELLLPQINIVQRNTEKAADKLMQVVKELKGMDDAVGRHLWDWNNHRFEERIKFHNTMFSDATMRIKEVERELSEIQQIVMEKHSSHVPADLQEQMIGLQQERDLLRQRHNLHSKHKGSTNQQWVYFKQANAKYSKLDEEILQIDHHDFTEAAETFKEFPDSTGALPGFINTVHNDLMDHLVMLKRAVLDTHARAEALLVKARTCAMNCMAAAFHKPPATLINHIKELACEQLEQRMRDYKSAEAEKVTAQLLMDLELESSKQRGKDDKEKEAIRKKKAKTKGKGKKAKKKPDKAEAAATSDAGEEQEGCGAGSSDEREAENGEKLGHEPVRMAPATFDISELTMRLDDSLYPEHTPPAAACATERDDSPNWDATGQGASGKASREELLEREGGRGAGEGSSPTAGLQRAQAKDGMDGAAAGRERHEEEALQAGERVAVPSAEAPLAPAADASVPADSGTQQQLQLLQQATQPDASRPPQSVPPSSHNHQPPQQQQQPKAPREPVPGQSLDDIEKHRPRRRRKPKKPPGGGRGVSPPGEEPPAPQGVPQQEEPQHALSAAAPEQQQPAVAEALLTSVSAAAAPASVVLTASHTPSGVASAAASSVKPPPPPPMMHMPPQGMMVPPQMAVPPGHMPLPGAVVTPLPGAMGMPPHMLQGSMPFAMAYLQGPRSPYMAPVPP
eukprot:CAMPEP_0117661566 /NCGR_PEP_ID=MMETSP0804-20121206/7605_1 /TAXON_ID=1074897 /ORGANISM="Tetraselmis astigmatica, Strain CCMP880" /LENGTH=1774 /DNA_ID=CAMNT_0005468441 /DNA_START=277 /DNA_END=5598 /DNA_ORIENTATION=-